MPPKLSSRIGFRLATNSMNSVNTAVSRYALETAPLWLIWIVITVGLIIAYEIGYRFLSVHRGFQKQLSDDDEKGTAIGYMLPASLALLGLLIAFTFSMAAERFQTRRSLVVGEANAVGTTYLRLQLLDEPARTSLNRLMLSYIQAREDFFTAGDEAAKIAAADARTLAVETLFWNGLSAALRAQPSATINPSLLETANEMFDLAASDRAALEGRVPISILRAILIYSVISAGFMGYAMALRHRRHLVGSTALFVLIALSISLIADLDRPRTGSVTVSNEPFSHAAKSIREMDAATAQARR